MKSLTFSFAVSLGLLLASALFVLIPGTTFAATATARLGGGNALMRVTIGQSQGVSNANSTSNLFDHLTLASTRGGMPEETPANENSNTGGGVSSEQSDGENGADASSAGGAGGAGGNNGSTQAGDGGNGGNGGNADPGGLVRAGSSVSNATAINAINTNILRISIR